MSISMRRMMTLGLGILALLTPMSARGQAQFRPPVVNPALGLALNPYTNPFAAQALLSSRIGPVFAGRSILAASGMTHPLAALAGSGYGYNLGLRNGAMIGLRNGAMMGMNYGANMMSPYSNMGYGSLMNGSGSGLGASAAYGLASSALSGAGYGYGFGLGNVQWMMNPYQGYLQGAADITRAQADWQKGIQQARLTREEARRSALSTRRAVIEQIDWEREHMPDPEKLRQQSLERELNHARLSPPLTDIWTARSLNALLRNLVNQQGDGVKGPTVPLDEDIVKHINVTAGNSGGNVGLLKNNGELDWPEPLNQGIFKEDRERINRLIKTAYDKVDQGGEPQPATLTDLQDAYDMLRKNVDAHLKEFNYDDGIEIDRYLRDINDTLKALKDENIRKYLGEWKLKAKNVAELVKFMRENGLQFAAAKRQDLAAYVALYNALAAFDASLPRLASRASPGAEDK